MILTIEDKYLYNENNNISWELFSLMTGRDEKFLSVRTGKKIKIIKNNIHISIYDIELIKDQIYRYKQDFYKCKIVDINGYIMEKLDSTMTMLFTNDINQWDAVNESTFISNGYKKQRRRRKLTSIQKQRTNKIKPSI